MKLFALLILFCVCISACGSPSADSSPPFVPNSETRRLVTLSPHLAELVFAVGSGDQLVGVSAYTDFPTEAARLPVIGDAFNLDQEQLTLLAPDVLLAWDTGTPQHVVDELRSRGFVVEVVTTTSLSDIPEALKHIGQITGNSDEAGKVATAFESGLAEISEGVNDMSSISVFYQVDVRPLYTINGNHFVSQLISLCGGRNIFEDLGGLAPLVSVESVLELNPDIILASSDAGGAAFDEWHRWTGLAANRFGNSFIMPANDIGRPTPRLLAGAKAVCDALNTGRQNRERWNDE